MSDKKTCVTKLKKEMTAFARDPPPYIPAISVNEGNILEWYFLIEGPPNSPYEGGWYIGKLKFPPEYPFKPPSIFMLTQTGRFSTDVRLCLSMSDYHPESWNPMWSVASVLTGLLSFMLEDTKTAGSIETTDEAKRAIAAESSKRLLSNTKFKTLFPQLPELINKRKENKALKKNEAKVEMVESSDSSMQKEARPTNESSRGSVGYEKAIAAMGTGDFYGALRACQAELSRGASPLEGHQLAATCCLRIGSFEDAHAHLAEGQLIERHILPEARQDWWQWAGSALRGMILASEVQQREVFLPPNTMILLSAFLQEVKHGYSKLAEVAEAACIAEREVCRAESALIGDGGEGGDPEDALHILDVIIAKYCYKSPSIHMLKAKALAILGDFDASIKVMESVMDIIASSRPLGFVNLGPESLTNQAKARWSPSNISSEEVLDELGNVRTASRHRSKGNEHFRKGKYELALQSYAKALAVEETCASIHANRAAALAALGRYEDAIAACDRALQLHRGYAKVRRRKAECLSALGKHHESIIQYMKALELCPQDPELLALVDEQKQLFDAQKHLGDGVNSLWVEQ